MSNALVPMSDLREMAKVVRESGMFPALKTEAAVMSLMLMCQADGLHPAQAMRRYHILSQGGTPAMRADTMLAEFQSHGGQVEWLTNTDDECSAKFFAPGLTKPVQVTWTIATARKAQLNSPMWAKYPRAMLRSRVTSEGIRMAMPGVIIGIYTPEEAEEIVSTQSPSITYERDAPAVLAMLRTPAKQEVPAPQGDIIDAEGYADDDCEITDPVDVFDSKTGELIGQRDGCTTAQKAKAHALKNELGIDDATWRTRLKDLFGKDSMKDVSREEASTLIDKLEIRKRTYGTAAQKQERQAKRAQAAVEEITGALASVSREREPGED